MKQQKFVAHTDKIGYYYIQIVRNVDGIIQHMHLSLEKILSWTDVIKLGHKLHFVPQFCNTCSWIAT